MKFTAFFEVNELLQINILVGDNMKANFNQKLGDLFKEAVNFAVSQATGKDYVEPTDDTKNIANGANYYPGLNSFVPGG